MGVGKRVCTIKVRVNLGALWLLYCTCAHTYMDIIKKECHQNEVGSIKRWENKSIKQYRKQTQTTQYHDIRNITNKL